MSAAASSNGLQTITLSNGVKVPSVAFGSAFGSWTGGEGFQGFTPELAWSSIPFAIEAGYRHFDGAHAYSTERQTGDILGQHFAKGTLKREDLFITTKVAHPKAAPHLYISERRTWNGRDYPTTEAVRNKVLTDFDYSLDQLGVGYVDLLLMHWPGAFDEKDAVFNRAHRHRVWKAFEELYKKRVTRAIGVSNFTQKHLEELLEDGVEIVPQVNQIELHPYCQDAELVKFCESKKIVVAAYAPLASGAFDMLKDPVLVRIASEVKRGVGQVILRWHLQHGHVVLPKSTNANRAKENLSLFDFNLSEQQMKDIDALHPAGAAAKRTCPDPSTIV